MRFAETVISKKAKLAAWAVCGSLIAKLMIITPAGAQSLTAVDVYRMLPTLSSELNYHKWPDGAPIKVFIVVGKQRDSCAEISLGKIRRQIEEVRSLVPQLRNVSDPVIVDRIPEGRIESPLLLGLETSNESIRVAMKQFVKSNNRRAQYQEFDYSNIWVGFGEGFGIEDGRIVASYSWTTSRQGAEAHTDKTCRESTWDSDILTELLGAQGLKAITGDWKSMLSAEERTRRMSLVRSLFLKALYSCPGSPAEPTCVRQRFEALIGSSSL